LKILVYYFVHSNKRKCSTRNFKRFLNENPTIFYYNENQLVKNIQFLILTQV